MTLDPTSNSGGDRSRGARVYSRPRTADLARHRFLWIVLAVCLALLLLFLIQWLRR